MMPLSFIHSCPTPRFLLYFAVIPALLAGCAGSPLRSYDKEIGDTLSMLRSGELDGALEQLESNNASLIKDNDKDILYYFEKGELLRLKNDYEPSRDAWLQADTIVREWEEEYRANPGKIVGEVGSYLVSDRVRRYDGQDYEKVFLSTKLMLDHIMLGNTDHARIEMKKTFEREMAIKNFREQEYEKLLEEENKLRAEGKKPQEEGSKPRNAGNGLQEEDKSYFVEIKSRDVEGFGYPMDRLDTPEVNALKNGYQNAFAHYLSGYFFEMMGEPSLSEPGYRNALRLRPDSALARAKLGSRGKQAKPGPKEADVLFVVESGQAPAWKSVMIPLMLPINRKLIVVPLSFPVLVSSGTYTPASLRVAERALPVEMLVNVDAMAKRQLKDQLSGIIVRTVIRGIVKGVGQYEAQKHAGGLGGLLAKIATVATEQADERSWRTLPGRLSIARAILPVGEQTIEFRTIKGVYRGRITVGGKINIVPIRLVGDFVYIGQQGANGSVTELPASQWAKVEEDEGLEEVQKKISALTETRKAAALAGIAAMPQSQANRFSASKENTKSSRKETFDPRKKRRQIRN